MRIPFLSKEELSKLNTKRLLAYKRKFMKFPETMDEYAGTGLNYDPSNKNISKSHPWWQETYKNLKEILSSREHIER
jgi:hypothetical protein